MIHDLDILLALVKNPWPKSKPGDPCPDGPSGIAHARLEYGAAPLTISLPAGSHERVRKMRFFQVST